MSCVACELKLKPNDEDDKTSLIEVQRYDRLESRYLTTGDFSALQQMNTEYPMETRTLIEKVLQIGLVEDPEINTKFLNFYQDTTLQTIIAETEAQYANMDDINQQLNDAIVKLRKWIPNMPIPNVYSQIGALDQSIVVGNQSIGISLDKYLGEDYPLYFRYYNESQRKAMKREFILPDCLSFYLLSLYPIKDFDNRPQIDKDLHLAKVMWVVNKALGKKFFNTKYVDKVDKYMSINKKETISDLLINNDFSTLYNI